jgi:hypothetical protein
MNPEYDIFISYSANNKQGESSSNTWARQFCHHLMQVLQRLFDEKPTILLHDDVRSRQTLMNENPADIYRKTGVFITIITPEDANSPEYIQVMDSIQQIAYSNESDSSSGNRIFKIVTAPLPEDQDIESLQKELQYNFFEINRYSKKPVTYPLIENQPPDDKFWSKLVDLSYDIYNSLHELKKHGTKDGTGTNSNAIFLAETSFDQQENRDILKRELRHLGYKVLPMLSIPNDSDNARAIIDENIRQSLVSIHMMGAYYGDFMKNSKYSLIDFQARLVKEFIESKEKCPKPYQIIWIPSDLKTTDQRQSLYLKRLNRDESQEKTEIIEAPLEVFKTIVNNKLNELSRKAEVIPSTGYLLYLICEEQENQKLQEYKNLIANRGFSILTNPANGKEYYSITEHVRILKKADAVLIYKGDSSMEWLNSKIRDLVKVPGFGKEKPFKAIGIFSPQKTTDKSLLFLRNVTVIWNEEINNTTIHHFLDQIIKK